MEHGGAHLEVIGFVISIHVLGMFAFSPLVGWAADRFGRSAVLVTGGVVLLVSLAAQVEEAVSQGATLHVIASRKEGWGLSVLEAAACGVPTVATDVPGLRESVIHERTATRR